MVVKKSLIIFLFIFAISFIIADYSDCSIYGNCKPATTTTSSVNYPTVNTNNSLYWNGYSYHNMSLPFYNWFPNFYNMTKPAMDYADTIANKSFNQSFTDNRYFLNSSWPKYLNFTNGTTIQTCQNASDALNWTFFRSGVYSNSNEATFFNNTDVSINGISLRGTNLSGDFKSMVFYNSMASSNWNITLHIANITSPYYPNTNITLQIRVATNYNISDSGLVALWGFNNGSGESATLFKDETGRNNGSCTTTACPGLNTSAIVGNSMTFDGVDDYVDTTININATIENSFSAWVYVNSFSNYPVIFGNCVDTNSACTGSDYGVYGAYFDNTGKLVFYLAPSNYAERRTSGTTVSTYSTNTWYFITGVMNTTNNNVTIYVNGVNQSITYSNVGTGSSSITKKIYLGAMYDSYSGTPQSNFNGSIDEVRIYNRSLSAAEVLDLYQLGSYHINWNNNGAYTNLGTATDNSGLVTNDQGKFMQFKTIFNTNSSLVSPYLINYSLQNSYGGVNTTTCQNTTYNSTLNFGDTVLIAKDYLTHSLFYTGDALGIISNIRAYSEDKSIGNIKQINHDTITELTETRNGVQGQSVDKTLALLLRASQQLDEKDKDLQSQIDTMNSRVFIIEKDNTDLKKKLCDLGVKGSWC